MPQIQASSLVNIPHISLFFLLDPIPDVIAWHSQKAGGLGDVSIRLVDGELDQSQKFLLKIKAGFRERKGGVEPIAGIYAGGLRFPAPRD